MALTGYVLAEDIIMNLSFAFKDRALTSQDYCKN
jgi:hypothetical protein